MREVILEVPQMAFAAVEPGDIIYSGTRAVSVVGEAVDTTGELRVSDVPEYWQERPLLVCVVEGGLDPSAPLTLKCLDLREQWCSLWWPMVSKLGVDNNDTGIAYLDNGGGRTANRNQTGYAKRPDGLYTDRAASTTDAGLRYYSYRNLGLHIEDGAEHTLLNSTFSTWGGGAPTSWTRVVAGTATASQDTTRYLCDVAGLQSSIRFVNDGAGAAAYVHQTSATWIVTHYGRVRLVFEAASSAAVPQFLLRRSDGADYDFAAGSWTGGSPGLWTSPLAVGTIMDSDAASLSAGTGASVGPTEWQSEPFAAGGAYDMTLYVGNMTGASVAGTVHLAQLVRGGKRCPAWPVVPTVGAAITALGEYVNIDNSTACRVVNEDRGTIEMRWRPSFGHADMADDTSVALFVSYRQGVAVLNENDLVRYHRTDAANGEWEFRRRVAGVLTTASYAVSGAGLLAEDSEYRTAVRWTGAHAELGLASYTMDLFVDGALVATAVSGAPNAANNNGVVYLGRAPIAGYGHAGGWYNRLAMQTYCKTDTEIIAGMVV